MFGQDCSKSKNKMISLHYCVPDIDFVESVYYFQICQNSFDAGFEDIGEENWV